MNKQNKKNETLNKLAEELWIAVKMLFMTCIYGFARIPWEKLEFYTGVIVMSAIICAVVKRLWIFQLLHYFWPAIFTTRIVDFFALEHTAASIVFFHCLAAIMYLFMNGIRHSVLMRRMQKHLDFLRMKIDENTRPTVVNVKEIDKFRTLISIASAGFGVERYQNRTSDIQASFGEFVESISIGANPKFIEIHLTKKLLPKTCRYLDLARSLHAPYSFVVGEAMEGTITQSIVSLPHLLIAGTTGGGKSVFFNQVILSLLQTSPYLQMYLLDLKGGLEMKPFSAFSNVRVGKDISTSLQFLQAIKLEMNKRFAYLEKNDFKEIKPERDKMDRIVVGVDEASLLYGIVTRTDSDFKTIMEARKLTDEIAKLGRAAGIHLILATQKITKETISTSIQENVTGRMCFRMNTIQGSVVVLGNKAAIDLEDIPGRAIWSCGTKVLKIQAPLITEKNISDEIELAKMEDEKGKKRSFNNLLDVVCAIPAKAATSLENVTKTISPTLPIVQEQNESNPERSATT